MEEDWKSKDYSDYQRKGMHALYLYASELVLESVKEIEGERVQLYYNKDFLSKVKKSLESHVEDLNGEDYSKISQGYLAALNKNPILDFCLGVIGESVFDNQEKINTFFRELKCGDGESLYDKGYDESFILRALSLSQKKGLLGKESGTEMMLDKVMNDLPDLVDAAAVKDPRIIAGLMMANSLEITPESLRDAYRQAGFKGKGGVIGNIITGIQNFPYTKQLFESGKQKLEEKVNGRNFKLDLSGLDLDECINAYRLFGLDGEQGVVNIALTHVLGNLEGFGGAIFSYYTLKFAEKDKKAVKTALEGLGYVKDSREKEKVKRNLENLKIVFPEKMTSSPP